MPPFSPRFAVKVRNFEWDKIRFPIEEDALGEQLFSLVVEKSFVSALPLELWLFTESAIQTIAFQEPVNHHHVSALCGLDGVCCAALLGPFRYPNGTVHGQVFIEWEDCRWWFGRQPLQQDGSISFQFPKVSKATASDSKPHMLGGWFSTARRMGLKASLQVDEGYWEH